jgi:hypothetical protein
MKHLLNANNHKNNEQLNELQKKSNKKIKKKISINIWVETSNESQLNESSFDETTIYENNESNDS